MTEPAWWRQSPQPTVAQWARAQAFAAMAHVMAGSGSLNGITETEYQIATNWAMEWARLIQREEP